MLHWIAATLACWRILHRKLTTPNNSVYKSSLTIYLTLKTVKHVKRKKTENWIFSPLHSSGNYCSIYVMYIYVSLKKRDLHFHQELYHQWVWHMRVKNTSLGHYQLDRVLYINLYESRLFFIEMITFISHGKDQDHCHRLFVEFGPFCYIKCFFL